MNHQQKPIQPTKPSLIKPSQKILIRADASVQIGTGHVMRCLTLADELRGRGGAEVVFVCREFDGNLCGYIEEKGYVVHRLPVSNVQEQNIESSLKHAAWLGADWQTDAMQVEEIIKDLDTHPDWLIVDHYALDERWEGYLRPYVKKVMVIDDLADRAHDCDLLLDQNFYENLESRYDGLVPSGCKKLLGPKYALLRPEFREARKNLRKRDGNVKRIMIFFGGSDPSNETARALEAIRMLNRPDIAVDVVVGSANPNKDEINKLCASMANIAYHCQVENMAQLMTDADLFIGGGGSTTWETAFMGLPSLIITLADNQADIAKGLGRAGACIDLGWYESISINQYAQALKEMLQDKNKRLCLIEQGQKLVDGKGSQRVIKAMLIGQIKLRKAQENDCELLWRWVNDPKVRQSAFNSKDISWEDHNVWFLNKQNDPNCFQYIALNSHDIPIGQIRFDINDSVAEIDYSVDKNFRDMGLGKILLKKGIEFFCAEVEKPITIQGCVKKENEPSSRVFEDIGFQHTHTHTSHLSITILSDKKSWINAYIPILISEFALLGQRVTWVHNVAKIKKGDISFYLSCGQIVSANILSKNKHNLVVHESALPKGKGWSPLTWQILEGKNEIPITLFEAKESVDSGKIYIRKVMHFDGTELVEELRQKQAQYTIKMCVSFVKDYPGIISRGKEQSGISSYYKKRKPEDSKLDTDKTIREQFSLLRVVDNEHYPAYFEIAGERYFLKIEKAG